MQQTLLEMAKDLVAELIRQYQIAPEEVQSLLLNTHTTLQTLRQMEVSGTQETPLPKDETHEAWRRSITRHAVICLEALPAKSPC